MSERLCKCEHNFDAHRPSIQHRDRTACHICACVEWRPEPAPDAMKRIVHGENWEHPAVASPTCWKCLQAELARAESELRQLRRDWEHTDHMLKRSEERAIQAESELEKLRRERDTAFICNAELAKQTAALRTSLDAAEAALSVRKGQLQATGERVEALEKALERILDCYKWPDRDSFWESCEAARKLLEPK